MAWFVKIMSACKKIECAYEKKKEADPEGSASRLPIPVALLQLISYAF